LSVVFEVSDLTFGYGQELILKGVSLKVSAGEVLIVLGPNGSGKTTLLRVMAGVLKPNKGSVKMLGNDVNVEGHLLDVDVGIDDYTFGNLTLFEAVYYHLVLRGIEPSKAKDTADMYLNLFEMTKVRNTHVHRLSAGQKKLATTLPAIASHPKVLLLDEPFEQIDPARKVKLAKEIINLVSGGAAVMLNTHEIEVLELLTDANAGIMLSGKYFGTVRPASELLDSYLVMEKPESSQVMLEVDTDGKKAYITRRRVKGGKPLRRVEDLAQLYAL
jgi:ABC-type multidrug transport system ATPase subunit